MTKEFFAPLSISDIFDSLDFWESPFKVRKQFDDIDHFARKFLNAPTTYPVSNYFIKEDGTSVLEIACTGFKKEDIDISIDENLLVITGKSTRKQEGVKYVYKNIGEREFTFKSRLSYKHDTEKMNCKLENGLLIVEIPLKEEMKQIKKKIEITS